MRGIAVPALLVLIAIGGVVQSCGDPVAPSDGKSEVRDAHLQRLQLFLDADAEGYVASFAPGAVDIGGGPTGTGELPDEFFTAEHWESVFQSSHFQAQFAGKSIADVVDPTSTQVLSKAEAESEFGSDLGFEGTSFRMQDGDMVAFTEPTQNSPLFDVWFGVYRRIGGKWLVVALD